MFHSCTLIPQHLPVIMHTQQLDALQRARIHQHAFGLWKFPGQWQGHSSHLAVQKYPNSRYWPIPGTTTTPPPALDSIPSQPFLYKPHPEWIAAAQRREEILHKRNAKLIERYNRHTHNLCPLQAGDTVTIQNPLNRRWNTTGKIISALPERQYKMRVDGSGRITLRNHRFLKKCKLFESMSMLFPHNKPGLKEWHTPHRTL